MALILDIKMKATVAIFVTISFVGIALADVTKHDSIKCYKTDHEHPDQLGNEVDCDSGTCKKYVSAGGHVERQCNGEYVDEDRCRPHQDGSKNCYCHENLCNLSNAFKVNYTVIFGILALFYLV